MHFRGLGISGEKRCLEAVAHKFLDISDFNVEFYLLEVFICKLSFWDNFRDFNFGRLLNWFLLYFTTFLSILFCIFFLLFHLFLLLCFGLLFFDLFYLHILHSIDVRELDMISDIGIVNIEHGDGVRVSHQYLQFATISQITHKLLQFAYLIPSHVQASQFREDPGEPSERSIIDLIAADREQLQTMPFPQLHLRNTVKIKVELFAIIWYIFDCLDKSSVTLMLFCISCSTLMFLKRSIVSSIWVIFCCWKDRCL